MVSPFEQKATITNQGQNIVLNNGLVKRTFVIAPNVACFDYTNLTNGQQLIRSIEPEAKVVIDQITYKVGGLSGQKEKAYLSQYVFIQKTPWSHCKTLSAIHYVMANVERKSKGFDEVILKN